YVLVNAAYVVGLGIDQGGGSRAIATDLMRTTIGGTSSNIIAILVMISALGALNGLIFTGARVYSAMGTDHRLFAWLGRWNPRRKTPTLSIAIQALISIGLIVMVGSPFGQK